MRNGAVHPLKVHRKRTALRHVVAYELFMGALRNTLSRNGPQFYIIATRCFIVVHFFFAFLIAQNPFCILTVKLVLYLGKI